MARYEKVAIFVPLHLLVLPKIGLGSLSVTLGKIYIYVDWIWAVWDNQINGSMKNYSLAEVKKSKFHGSLAVKPDCSWNQMRQENGKNTHHCLPPLLFLLVLQIWNGRGRGTEPRVERKMPYLAQYYSPLALYFHLPFRIQRKEEKRWRKKLIYRQIKDLVSTWSQMPEVLGTSCWHSSCHMHSSLQVLALKEEGKVSFTHWFYYMFTVLWYWFTPS